MRLEKTKYSAYEAAWKRAGDVVKVDYLRECIPFLGSEQLDLKNIIQVHKFQVDCYGVEKYHFFKEKEYGIPRYLHVLAIERKKYKENVWLFLCDSKDLFCALVKEFAAAFTATIDTENGSRAYGGAKEYNASRFWKEAVEGEGAKLEFLYYLLNAGEEVVASEGPVRLLNSYSEAIVTVLEVLSEAEGAENKGGIITGCAFAVPGERRRRWDDFLQEWEDDAVIVYPSNAEKCVILDGEDFEKLYADISLLLPEQIEATKSIVRAKEEYGVDFSNKEKVLEKFQQSVSSTDLTVQVQNIQNELSRWADWIKSNQVEKRFGEEYLAVLSQKLNILEEVRRSHELEQRAEQKKKNSDNNGEKSVEYEIKWFIANYNDLMISIASDCESKYRYNCILLEKPDFIDKSQEYDHILICSGGILLIETKHWKGTVEIRSDGKWVRTMDGDRRGGVENPQSQMWKHETLMKAIVPGVTVSSVLCFSNTDVVIDGKEYFTDYPIIYVDQLKDYLNHFCGSKLYSESAIRSIAQIIESHKVNRMPKQ